MILFSGDNVNNYISYKKGFVCTDRDTGFNTYINIACKKARSDLHIGGYYLWKETWVSPGTYTKIPHFSFNMPHCKLGGHGKKRKNTIIYL